MRPSLSRLISAATLALCVTSSTAFAQASGGTTTLSGTVTDSGGGVVPGATVEVKNNATGQVISVVSNTSGAFSVPALNPGTYSVTVSLQGFKTAAVTDVRLLAATPADIKVVLEVGALTETVEVKGGSTLVNTQTATVTATMSMEQITNLPLTSRNALNAVSFLPGVETIYGSNQGVRQSTISGLPQNTINITIDGISNSNNLQSGDGFFSMVTPRLDAVEEVTVTGATPGADRAGQGAVNIQFVTRSGSNRFDSSIYHYIRNAKLNTNYFFNIVNGLDRNDVNVHQYGGRVGGPMIVPGLFDGRGKAFFFFNYEHFYQPTEVTRTRTMLNPDAERGIFTYNVTVGGVTEQRRVDLLALAASQGHLATPDPTIQAMLALVRAGAQRSGNISTPATATITQSYVYQAPSKRNEWAPTGRVDFNLTPSHRLTGSYYWQRFHSNPDILNSQEERFPGLGSYGIQASYRTTGSVTLRSTLGPNVVNELKGGWQWSPVDFFGNVTKSMFDFMGGVNLDVPIMTDPGGPNNPQPRNTVNWNVDNSLNWLKGTHSLNMGVSFTQILHDQNVYNLVPTAVIGFDTNNDPARLMFNNTLIAGASNTDLGNARNLYALITGRLTQVNGTARLNNSGAYEYLGNLNQKSRMNEIGLFFQDSWRTTPTLTLNGGVRWEVLLPFQATSSNWSATTLESLCGLSGIGSGPEGRQCNMFQPNAVAGAAVVPQYIAYSTGVRGYKTDWDNFAPNAGIAWRPNVQTGFLRTILGDPEQATLRGGYSLSFIRERMDRYTGVYGTNVGGTVNANRNINNGNLVYPGESWPLLLRETNRLGPPPVCTGAIAAGCMPGTPQYPINTTVANNMAIFDPDITTPFTHSWTVGWQRALGRDMAFELRYIGNRNVNAWTTENWNEENVFTNGFLEEFKLAQANLLANVAAGRGGTFAYFGPGTGTSPLPTYLAFFSGRADSTNPAAYLASTNWANTAWTGHLGLYEPDPFDAGNDLYGNATFRSNAVAAGLTPNHFVMNPAVGGANVLRAVGGSKYHSMQFDLRRRISGGLTATFNYTYALRYQKQLDSTLLRPRIYALDDNVPHAVKGTWVWELPVGRGKRFGTDMNRWLDGFIGGWEYSGTARAQWRQFVAEGVKLFGMTKAELQDEFKIRIVRSDTGTTTIFSFPDDIIQNTRRAFNTDPSSPTGYGADGPPTGRYLGPASEPGCIFLFRGDCGTPDQIDILGPPHVNFDMRIKKKFPFATRASVELDVEVLNVFNNINFNHAFNPGGGTGVFVVTSAYTDINTTFYPGGRVGQIVWRVSW